MALFSRCAFCSCCRRLLIPFVPQQHSLPTQPKQINVVTQNAESVQEVLAQKEQSLRMVSGFMQHRIMAFQQQAQAQQAAAQQALGGGRKP